MKFTFLHSMALLLVLSTVSAIAQTKDNPGQLSSKDFKFAREAIQGGAMEVTLGQIATQSGQDPAVRQFGTKMVQDHTAANQQLVQILSQKGATISDMPTWMDKKVISHLQGLKGTDFDMAYMKRMVSDHKDTIKLFQKQVESGDDADVKNFASKTLPTLEEHLRLAQETQ